MLVFTISVEETGQMLLASTLRLPRTERIKPNYCTTGSSIEPKEIAETIAPETRNCENNF